MSHHLAGQRIKWHWKTVFYQFCVCICLYVWLLLFLSVCLCICDISLRSVIMKQHHLPARRVLLCEMLYLDLCNNFDLHDRICICDKYICICDTYLCICEIYLCIYLWMKQHLAANEVRWVKLLGFRLHSIVFEHNTNYKCKQISNANKLQMLQTKNKCK